MEVFQFDSASDLIEYLEGSAIPGTDVGPIIQSDGRWYVFTGTDLGGGGGGGGGSGDVTGPSSSLDNQIARFHLTTGKIIQAGTNAPTYNDNGDIVLASGRTVDGVDVSAVSPSSDEKAALAGTDGTPSTSNRYVTDSDDRVNVQAAGTASIRALGTGATDAAPGDNPTLNTANSQRVSALGVGVAAGTAGTVKVNSAPAAAGELGVASSRLQQFRTSARDLLDTGDYGAASGVAQLDADSRFPATSLQQNTARILGRTTASAGATEELTVGSSMSLAAGSLNTIQGVRTADTPQFAGLGLGGAAGTTGTLKIAAVDPAALGEFGRESASGRLLMYDSTGTVRRAAFRGEIFEEFGDDGSAGSFTGAVVQDITYLTSCTLSGTVTPRGSQEAFILRVAGTLNLNSQIMHADAVAAAGQSGQAGGAGGSGAANGSQGTASSAVAASNYSVFVPGQTTTGTLTGASGGTGGTAGNVGGNAAANGTNGVDPHQGGSGGGGGGGGGSATNSGAGGRAGGNNNAAVRAVAKAGAWVHIPEYAATLASFAPTNLGNMGGSGAAGGCGGGGGGAAGGTGGNGGAGANGSIGGGGIAIGARTIQGPGTIRANGQAGQTGGNATNGASGGGGGGAGGGGAGAGGGLLLLWYGVLSGTAPTIQALSGSAGSAGSIGTGNGSGQNGGTGSSGGTGNIGRTVQNAA